jgi:cob(I)alamin adenosyltransferase
MKNSIVTKTGDSGETFLIGGKRVQKNNIRVHAYGEVDELNALLGVVVSFISNDELKILLKKIQQDLFEIGADLARPINNKENGLKGRETSFYKSLIDYLDKSIQKYENQLPQLKNFIIPGGSKAASFLHLARTVCRRTERAVVHLSQEELLNPLVLVYLNRFSDLLFIMARYENLSNEIKEIPWISQKKFKNSF